MCFRDVGLSFKGREGIIKMKRRMCDAMPDMYVSVEAAWPSREREAMISAMWSGTQREEFLPLFPRGKCARWHVQLRYRFDEMFKLDAVTVLFEPVLALTHLPSNMEGLARCALQLASTATGSRLLQVQSLIIKGMRGHAWELSASPHGNHVLQLLITTTPHQLVAFIVAEFRGRAVGAAMHMTRSRILERLLEHCPLELTTPLIQELLPRVAELSQHRFGNFVVQRMIEHGGEAVRRDLAQRLAPHLQELTRCQHANIVVGAAFRHCSAEEQQILVHSLAAVPGGIRALLRSRHGSFVVRQMRLAGAFCDTKGAGRRSQPAA